MADFCVQYGSGGFAKILASRWGNFFCPPRTLSNLRSGFLRDGEFTHRKPATIPPQNQPVTCRNRWGFNFYPGGRISNCWWRQHDWQLKNFPYTCILLSVRHVWTTNTMIRLRMHRLVRTCAIGGNPIGVLLYLNNSRARVYGGCSRCRRVVLFG